VRCLPLPSADAVALTPALTFAVALVRALVLSVAVALAVAFALALLAGCASLPSAGLSPDSASGRRCVERGGLPDRRCTPGAVRSGVPLAVLCAPGYSRSVRPPESFTEPLKFAQIRAYGLSGRVRDYEEDHLVPLSIGGAPRDPANLWPQPRSGPYNAGQKDALETWAARTACSGRIPLARLQHEMAADWTALYRAAGGARLLRSYAPGG
jgi:hypothetical protein